MIKTIFKAFIILYAAFSANMPVFAEVYIQNFQVFIPASAIPQPKAEQKQAEQAEDKATKPQKPVNTQD